MTVILRDKHNRKLQFTRKRPASRDPALPAFTSSQDALTFLHSFNTLTAKDWFNIHAQIRLTSPKEINAIRQQLAMELTSNKLHLIPAESVETCGNEGPLP